MARVRSPFRAVMAGAAVVVVAGASLLAGVAVANAAPGAPTITSPVTGSAFTTNTITVSGTLADFTDQEVTVTLDGAPAEGCIEVPAPYFNPSFTCDITVPGPGTYELRATTFDLWALDPDDATSEPSNAVTFVVGNSNPALLGYPESGTAWNTLTPQLSGSGPALGEVEVEILAGEGSATYCVVAEVPASGSWSCTPSIAPNWSWGEVEFRAYGLDVTGNPTADDQIVGELVPPPPTTEIVPGPARASFSAQGTSDTFLETRVFEAVLNGEGSSFTLREVCSAEGDPPAVECSLTGLAPGVWNFYTNQDFNETYFSTIDEFIRIPSAPTGFDATLLADRSVRFSGQGEPGFRAIVRGVGGNSVCSAIVGAGGTWQCTATPPAGTSSFRSLQQSVGFDTNDFEVSSDRSIDGFSALTSAISVTVPTAPAPSPLPTVTTRTPLPWVLEGYDGSPLTPGQALNLRATGLPVGTVVVVEIRSTPRVLGTSVVDDSGVFALDVVVPDDLEPGQHTLVATATPPGGVESVVAIPVTVLEPAQPIDEAPPVEEPEAVTENDNGAGGAGGAAAAGDRSQPATPSAISDSIPTLERIFASPVTILVSGGLALAILLLVAFPAELLNSTLASNTRRLGRWYAAIESGVERATDWFASVTRTRALAAAVLVVLTSLIFGFVDPDYGFDPVSLRMTVSLAIGLFIVTYVSAWISGAIIRRAWSIETRVSLQPAALVFAVIGVVIARILEFSPGFLIGLVIGLDLITRVGAAHRVRAILTNIGVIVGLAVLAWVGFSILSALMTGEPTAVGLLVSDALVATTAEGLTAALAALLPLGFLDGHEVFRRSKLLWAGSFAAVATVFSLIVLPTAEGETGEVADVGFWMLVMVIFAAVTLTLWAILHFTGRGDGDDDELVEQPAAAAR